MVSFMRKVTIFSLYMSKTLTLASTTKMTVTPIMVSSCEVARILCVIVGRVTPPVTPCFVSTGSQLYGYISEKPTSTTYRRPDR